MMPSLSAYDRGEAAKRKRLPFMTASYRSIKGDKFLLVAVHATVWIGYSRTGHPSIKRHGIVLHRNGPAELSLNQRYKRVLECTKPRDAAVLIEYHKQIFSIAGIYLTRECTHSMIGLAECTCFADDTTRSEVGIKTIFKRSFVDTGDGHDIGERHMVPGKIASQPMQQTHHRIRRDSIEPKAIRRLY